VDLGEQVQAHITPITGWRFTTAEGALCLDLARTDEFGWSRAERCSSSRRSTRICTRVWRASRMCRCGFADALAGFVQDGRGRDAHAAGWR
jgi:hypothetical protein